MVTSGVVSKQTTMKTPKASILQPGIAESFKKASEKEKDEIAERKDENEEVFLAEGEKVRTPLRASARSNVRLQSPYSPYRHSETTQPSPS